MSFLDGARFRLHALFRPGRYARELDEELRFHLSLDAMQQEHDARGALAPDDARWLARRRFGNMVTHTEEARTMAGLALLDHLRQDVRFALRSFRRTPGFTIVAVLTLAIGIGANTAIFSAVNAMLLRPLPFAEPERLMSLGLTSPATDDAQAQEGLVWSYPKFTVLDDAQDVFASLALHAVWQRTVRTTGESGREEAEVVSGRYLRTLGVLPLLGRDLTAGEDRIGAARVALLGHDLWERDYGADPSALGRTLHVDGDPYTIVGVLPPGFRGLSGRAALWLPILAVAPEIHDQAWSHSFEVVGRLRPGVTPERAQAEVRRLGAVVDAAVPHPAVASEHWGAAAQQLDALRVDPLVRRSLLVLLGAVGLVLLIACANVANLSLVRAAGRRREIAVRLAVGAGRGRLVRQLLTESTLLAAVGGAGGLLVAWWGVRVLAALDPTALRVQRMAGLGAVSFDSIRLDLPALLVAMGLTLGTGLLFGLIPALQATRPALGGALRNERQRGGGGRFSGRSVLAATEIALAVVLLSGSGLMLRSLVKLMDVHPGFSAEQVLTLRLTTRPDFAGDSLPVLYDQLLERLGGLPGAVAVGLGDCPPLSGGCGGTVAVRRDRPLPEPGTEPSVGVHWVTPGWFDALQVPLVRGRLFTGEDRAGARKAVLVNETAAQRLWPGEDPLGKPLSVGQGGFWNDTAYVAGIVRDVRFGTRDTPAGADVYLPYHQSPRGRMMVFLRTTGNSVALATAAREVMNEVAPGAPVSDVRTLESRVADVTASARLSAMLLTLFAGVALALATIGVYGVISFGVAQRTREIGVRMALGATHGGIARLVVGQGVALAVIGAAVGLVVALAATRVLRTLLYGIAPADPVTYAVTVLVLVAAVLLASWIPARRAARVAPTVALREG